MSSAIVLILISLGANVNAEEIVADILVDRASDHIVGGLVVDLDDSTLQKGAKGSAPAPRTKGGAPKKGTFTPIQQQKKTGGRVFGGTNTKNNKNADMAIFKGVAKGIYTDEDKTKEGRFGFGFERFGKVGGEERAVVKKPSGIFTPFNNQVKKGRDYGGVNTKTNANARMAILKGPAAEMYAKPKKGDSNFKR